MKPGELTARILVAVGLAICTVFAFAAPVSIGFVAPDEEPRYTNLLLGLRQGLHAAGARADNVTIIEHRVPRGDSATALRAAESLSAGRVSVVFVVGTELTKSVRSVAKELPIVFITPGDPVRAGLAASLGRPGNNLTGMTFEFPELSAKRLELLKEITPSARRVGVVFDPRDSSPRQGFAAAREAAARLGMHLVEVDVENLSHSGSAATRADKLDGLVLIPGGAISTVIEIAVKLAAVQRIVAVTWTRNEVTRETILSYGVNDVEVARNAARLVVRVLDGHPAGDLPIEQPTRFELVVNLKAAKALGITIPQSLLLRADEVIQ
jgi:putative tryptophan/tyrosine transport system substrate-binding protein